WCGEEAGAREPGGIPRLVAGDRFAWRGVPGWHGVRVARIDRTPPFDDQPQPVRDDLLHPGRPARGARHRRVDHHADRARPGPGSPGHERQPGRGWAGLLVLALRGWSLGGRLHGGLSGGTVSVRFASWVRERRMASDAQTWPQPEAPAAPDSVEMPRPAAAPVVLALGMTLLAAGVALGTAFLVVGAVVVVAGLSIWIAQLLPGRGHVHESLVETARPQPVMARPGGVEHLRAGMPG